MGTSVAVLAGRTNAERLELKDVVELFETRAGALFDAGSVHQSGKWRFSWTLTKFGIFRISGTIRFICLSYLNGCNHWARDNFTSMTTCSLVLGLTDQQP